MTTPAYMNISEQGTTFSQNPTGVFQATIQQYGIVAIVGWGLAIYVLWKVLK